MADSVDFELKLIDAASGPAKQAAAALSRVQQRTESATRKLGLMQSAAQRMNQALDQARGNRAAKALDVQARTAGKATEATRKLALMQMQAQKMDATRNKSQSFGGGVKRALGLDGIGGKVASGAFFGELAASGAMAIGNAFISGAEKAVSLVTTGIKMAFVEGGKAENLRLSYKLLLGAQGGKEALSKIGGFAGKTKYDDDAIAEMMRPLFNAGLKGKGATSAFAASGDLEAAGLGPAQEFIEQFAKIQLKGGVTEKLLIGMGVNVKDFKAALAKETGVLDKETAFKRATEGKSDPQAIMNAIFSGIEKRQGGQIGTGTEAASKTMSARLEKIGNLPSQYLKKMSEGPAWEMLSDRLGEVLSALDPDSPKGQVIVGKLFDVFNKITNAIQQLLEPANLDSFISTIGTIVTDVGKIVQDVVGVAHFIAHPVDGTASAIWDKIKDPSGIGAMEAERQKNGDPDAAQHLAFDGDELAARRNQLYSQPAPGVQRGDTNVGGLTVHGGINITMPAGADAKNAAAEFYKEVDRKQRERTQADLERSVHG